MKVSELKGAELNSWVAKAIGWVHVGDIHNIPNYDPKKHFCRSGANDWWLDPNGWAVCGPCHCIPESYSSDWSQLGPLIEEYEIDLEAPRLRENYWSANTGEGDFGGMGDGETPLIAACRAIVASKYGESVKEPKP